MIWLAARLSLRLVGYFDWKPEEVESLLEFPECFSSNPLSFPCTFRDTGDIRQQDNRKKAYKELFCPGCICDINAPLLIGVWSTLDTVMYYWYAEWCIEKGRQGYHSLCGEIERMKHDTSSSIHRYVTEVAEEVIVLCFTNAQRVKFMLAKNQDIERKSARIQANVTLLGIELEIADCAISTTKLLPGFMSEIRIPRMRLWTEGRQ